MFIKKNLNFHFEAPEFASPRHQIFLSKIKKNRFIKTPSYRRLAVERGLSILYLGVLKTCLFYFRNGINDAEKIRYQELQNGH